MIHFAIIKYTVSHFFFQLLDKLFFNHFHIAKILWAIKVLKLPYANIENSTDFFQFCILQPPTPKRLMVFFACTPSKTSGAIHAALPLLFVMCVWISQAVPKSQIFRTVPPIINSRLE